MSLKLTMSESTGFDLHEPDEWLAGTVTSIEESEGGKYGPGLKWVIQLDDEEWDTWAFCSQKLSPKSKLYSWLAGLDPQNLPDPGDVVDFSSYIGRRVQVMFEQYEADGVTKETVAKLRAEKKPSDLQKKQAAASKAKTTAPDDEAPF